MAFCFVRNLKEVRKSQFLRGLIDPFTISYESIHSLISDQDNARATTYRPAELNEKDPCPTKYV
jgi:hypothetical protein